MLKSRVTGVGRLIVVLAALLALAPLSALAGRAAAGPGITAVIGIGTCQIEIEATTRWQTWNLTNNCVTTESIVLPHGATLDGNGYIITAADPEGGSFSGAVITNEPVSEEQKRVTINVTNVKIDAGNLKIKCNTGDARLRGIWLNGASGSVTGVTIMALNQAESGCQEGNAIEAVNYDESSATTRVTIADNTVLNWMKTGILVNLNVDARITNNYVGASANETNLAPNSIQIGFGASADVMNNNLHGNEWLGTSDWAATGALIYEAGSVKFMHNSINYNPMEGNSDIGLYIWNTDNGQYIRNILYDHGEDSLHGDWGIYECGMNNILAANQVAGFAISVERCYTGPGRPTGATSMTTLSRGVDTSVVEAPPAPEPFI